MSIPGSNRELPRRSVTSSSPPSASEFFRWIPYRFGLWSTNLEIPAVGLTGALRRSDAWEKILVIGHQEMQRGFIFVDLGKTSERLLEDIVGQVVIDRRHLTDQHIRPLGHKAVPDAGQERGAFAWGKR